MAAQPPPINEPIADRNNVTSHAWSRWFLGIFKNDAGYGRRELYNGSFRETFNALVTSNGSTVTMSLEQSGGGNLTIQLSDGDTTFDCTPAATITLTVGSDASPQKNYIYILKSTKVLTKSTSDFPSTEHIKIGFFLVPSATYVQADGCYINQNWNDHLTGTDDMGHWSHIGERIRYGGALYFSGLAPGGLDQDTNASYFDDQAGASANFKMLAGVIVQAHKHNVSAVDTGVSGDVHVVNWNGDAYHDITDLFDIQADSAGVSLSNKYFNVYFFCVGNKTGEYAPIMAQLPDGSYVTQTSAENDVDGYDNITMPREFAIDSSTGVSLCRMTLKWTGGLGTLTHISTVDLRGNQIGVSGGGGGAGSTSFADNQFNIFNFSDLDELDFDLSNLTANRTITPADRDMDLDDPVFTSVQIIDDTDGVVLQLGDGTLSIPSNHGPILRMYGQQGDDSSEYGEFYVNKWGNFVIAGTVDYFRFVINPKTADNSVFTFGNENLFGIGFSTVGDQLQFLAGGNELDVDVVMVIELDGKIGIGRDDPSYLLDVDGTFRVTGASILGSVNIDTNIVMSDGAYIGQAAGPQIQFDDTNNDLEISGCKVKINLATDSEMVSILSDDNTVGTDIFAVRALNKSQGVAIGFQTIRKTGSTANSPLVIDSKGTGDITFHNTSTGNVGVKEASPAVALHVGGPTQCNQKIIDSDGKTDLETGSATLLAAQGNQDDVAGKEWIDVTPGAGTEYYSFSNLVSGVYYKIQNDSATTAAIIDDDNGGTFSITLGRVRPAMYDGTKLVPNY